MTVLLYHNVRYNATPLPKFIKIFHKYGHITQFVEYFNMYHMEIRHKHDR
jgi:hypothetical protein